MRNKIYLIYSKEILVLILFLSLSCKQNLSCEDFKIGTFYIENDRNDSEIKKWIIVRTEDEQIEYQNEIGKNPMFLKIEWIDECSFKLKYNNEKGKEGIGLKELDSAQFITINKVQIEKNCMIYESTGVDKYGQEFSRINKICKK